MSRATPEACNVSLRRNLLQLHRRRMDAQSHRHNYGAAMVVVTLAFVTGSLWYTLDSIQRDAEQSAVVVLEAISTGEVESIYSNLVTEQFRQTTELARYLEAMREATHRLGKLASSRPSDFHYNPFKRMAYLVYDVQFRKESGQIMLTLEWSSNRWLLDHLRVRSDRWNLL